MAVTPEGKVKKEVNKALAVYGKLIYPFMSVPYGYGKSTIDYLICFHGRFIGIETKAPGEIPTARQEAIMKEIVDAGGTCFVIDGDTTQLEEFLRNTHASSTGQHHEEGGGRTIRNQRREPVSRGKADKPKRASASRASAPPRRDVHAAKAGLRRS